MSMFGNRTAAPAPGAAAPAPAAPGGFTAQHAAAPPPRPLAPAPSRSRYAGVVCSNTRDPMLGLGTYRTRVISCVEGSNPGKGNRPSYKTTLYVEQAAEGSETAATTTVTVLALLHMPAGLGELKRMAMHAAGLGPTLDDRAQGKNIKQMLQDAEAEYNQLDESFGGEGSILESSAGHRSTAPSIVGRRVDVIVSRGKDVPNPQTGGTTGDYFRVYTWGVVPDAEQPQ